MITAAKARIVIISVLAFSHAVPSFGQAAISSNQAEDLSPSQLQPRTADEPKGDQIFYGPNPGIDARHFGLRAVNRGSTPAIPGCTASINAGSTTAKLSTQCGFQDGDWVIIYGAGQNNHVSEPAAPAVTPSGPAANTSVALDVSSQPGKSTYTYCAAAWNYGNGTATDPGTSVTACSSGTTIGTGQSSLGAQAVGIRSISCLNNACTVSTSAAESLGVGQAFIIGGASIFGVYGNYYTGKVASVTDRQHFTYNPPWDTRANGPTTNNGGPLTLYYVNSNLIRIPSAATGSGDGTKYVVYRSGPGGKGGIACLPLPQRAVMVGDKTYLACDDYGPTYTNTPSVPYYVPSSAPSSATNEALVSQIISGGGTTKITLADAASNSVSVAPILIDGGQPIVQAAAKALATQGTKALIPCGAATGDGRYYVVNAPMHFPSKAVVDYCGGLLLRDSMTFSATTWNGYYGSNGSSLTFVLNPYQVIGNDHAWPAIYDTNGSFVHYTQVNVPTGNLGYISSETNFPLLDRVAFSLGSSGTSYTTMGFVSMTNHAGSGGVPSAKWIDVNCTGQQIGVNGMNTPCFFFNNIGVTRLGGIHMSGQGALVRIPTAGSGGGLTIEWNYSQGNYMPYWSFVNVDGGTLSTKLDVAFPVFDTTCFPLATNYGNLILQVTTLGATPPGCGSIVSGTGPVVVAEKAASSEPEANAGATWAETDPVYISNVNDAIFGNQASIFIKYMKHSTAVGPGNTWFLQSYTPPAPACSASPGGALSLGAHTYQYAPIYVDGGQGKYSSVCSVTATSSNRTVSLKWPAIPLATGYMLSRNGLPIITCSVPNVTVASYTDAGAPICGTRNASESDGPIGMNIINGVAMLHAQSLNIAAISESQPLTQADNFNRPNGALNVGNANWTFPEGSWNISKNQAVGAGESSNDAAYTGVLISPNQFSEAVYISGSNGYVKARTQGSGGGFLCGPQGNSSVQLYFYEPPSTFTSIASAKYSVKSGDVLRIEAVGSNPTVLTCTVRSNGRIVLTFSGARSNYPTGSPGIQSQNGTFALDNWTGGSLYPMGQLSQEQDWTMPQHFRANGGVCTMPSATTCTISLAEEPAMPDLPHCIVTVQGVMPIAGSCSILGRTITVTAASPNSSTWAAFIF